MIRQETDSDHGACPFRLTPRQWLVVLVLTVLFTCGASPLWKRWERFDHGADYRVPYTLSNDYWLYERHLERSTHETSPGGRRPILVLGDSVVWGEYVLTDGTLSHFLTRQIDVPQTDTPPFINAGINGLFPLALEGLVRYHADPMHHQKVLLHCNLLWMSSPKADLSSKKEQTFNHAALVPQFRPRLPCYRAPREQRLSNLVRRQFEMFAWVRHLQDAYFDQQSVPEWTLAASSDQPDDHPNVYRNPLRQITGIAPGEPALDPQRGPTSERHRDWQSRGMRPQAFEWVPPEVSQQWAAFQRLVQLLESRDNDVLVVLGPFNEAMLAESSRAGFEQWQTTVKTWLASEGIPCVIPESLAPNLYGDTSHPLTHGYRELAENLWSNEDFAAWAGKS